MAQKSNNFERFWKELKRRKVVHVVTVYAAIAFGILQLVDIIGPSLKWPEWTMTFVIVLLCIGFIISVLVSWIYDITPAGVKKTKPISAVKHTEQTTHAVSSRWKIATYISAVIIVALVAFNFINKRNLNADITKRDKFEEIRDADRKISIAVMPFENLTGDTTLNWFQRGISSLIINGLGSSPELAVRDDQTMFEVMGSIDAVYTAGISPSMAKEVAEKVHAGTYISGSFQGTEGKYRIFANLVDTKSGDIIYTNKVEGDLKSSDYMDLTDSLFNEIKNYLEIKALGQKADYDYRETFPVSAEAYRYFIEGVNLILTEEYESAVKSLKKALEIDSTFTFAAFYVAFAYSFDNQAEQAEIWTQKAYNIKDRLPLKYQYWLEMWYACDISENPQDIIRYCSLLEKSGIESRLLWIDLGSTYKDFLHQYDKAVEAFEKIEKNDLERGSDWKYETYYEQYCEALLLADRPEDAKRIGEKGLHIYPKNVWLKVYKGSSNVMLGDTRATENNISEVKSLVKINYPSESYEEYAIGRMYLGAKDTTMAEKYFRKAYILNPDNIIIIIYLADVIIHHGINIEEGLEISQKGLNKIPDNNNLLWLKGVALHKLGKHKEALEILKKADEKWIGYSIDIDNAIKQVLASQKNN